MRFTEVVPALLIGSTAGCFDYAALQTGEKDLAMPAEADMAVAPTPDLATAGDMAMQPPDMAMQPTAWKSVQVSTGKKLFAIAGYDKSNVYAVGEGGTAYRWDGTTWQSDNIPMNTQFNAVSAYTDGATVKEVWAGGNTGVVFAKAGAGAWTNKNCDFNTTIFAITVAKKDDVLVVGNDKKTGRYWNGAAWAAADSNGNVGLLRAALAIGGSYFIAGDSGGFAESKATPPTSWLQNVENNKQDFFGIWGPARDNIFAVGQANALSKWNGNTISSSTKLDGASGANLRAIHGYGTDTNNIFVVGDSSSIYRYNGTTWTKETNSNVANYNLMGVYAADANNVWAIGNNGNNGAIFKR